MSKRQPTQQFNPGRALKKFLVSGFVIFTFIAYAVHERSSNSNGLVSAAAPVPQASQSSQVTSPPPPTLAPTQLVFPTPQPTAAEAPTAADPLTTGAPTDVPPTDLPPTAVPPTDVPPTATAASAGQYKDGTYTGPTVNVIYGLVQVEAVVQDGKLASVQFLQYPNDRRTSVRINSIAMPYLQTEAVQAQSANVNIISGATLTSEGFAMSLQSALDSAKN
jgi:uncharacterized protein with FMN-binding domain